MGQHPLGFAAQQQGRQAAPAMGGHHDHVAMALPGRLQDRLVDGWVHGGVAVTGHAGRVGLAAGFAEQLFGMGRMGLGELVTDRRIEHHDLPKQARLRMGVGTVLGMEKGDAGAGLLRDLHRPRHRGLGQLRAIGGHQQMAKHPNPGHGLPS